MSIKRGQAEETITKHEKRRTQGHQGEQHLALGRLHLLLLMLVLVVEARREDRHSFRAVAVLRALVATMHRYPGWNVCHAHRALCVYLRGEG
jgi:hypothetical protein